MQSRIDKHHAIISFGTVIGESGIHFKLKAQNSIVPTSAQIHSKKFMVLKGVLTESGTASYK